MSGRKRAQAPTILGYVDSTSNTSLTVPSTGYALIGLWGAGKAGGVPGGGDGGDAVFVRIKVRAGWVISWTVGAGGVNPDGAGGDTTVSLPGAAYRAKGGASANASLGPYISPGGLGGGAGVAGGAGGDGGGAAGSAAVGGGGGGSGGLRSKIAGFQTGGGGANGDVGTTGNAPGGGGSGNGLGGVGTNGAAGRVLVLLLGAG